MTRRKGGRSVHFMGKSGFAPLGPPESAACQHASIQPDDTFQDEGTCRDCGARMVWFYDTDRLLWVWTAIR